MASITDEDRAAAQVLFDALGLLAHSEDMRITAQTIADARERATIAERVACVAWVRDAEGDGVANDLIDARQTK